MAESAINIVVDEEALRKQVRDALESEMSNFAARLVGAAYSLSPKVLNSMHAEVWQQGYVAGGSMDEVESDNPYLEKED